MEGKILQIYAAAPWLHVFHPCSQCILHLVHRVVEVVRGVKGASCEKLTENIHKALGSVTYSERTEEYFEQELVVDNTVNVKAGEWDGSSSW